MVIVRYLLVPSIIVEMFIPDNSVLKTSFSIKLFLLTGLLFLIENNIHLKILKT
jgi:hypothetical protein